MRGAGTAVEETADSAEKRECQPLRAEEELRRSSWPTVWVLALEAGRKDTDFYYLPSSIFTATRRGEVAGIWVKFPSGIPVRLRSLPREQFLTALDKTKFLGPQGLTVTQFQGVMRNPMVLGATEAFHLLVNHRSVASMSVTVAEIYRDCKDEDGFVYMTCASQEVFGGLGSAAASWGQTLPSSPACVDAVL
ncbi:microtubule-associated proteins 1A/1B light chain 3C-like [Equus quagga]|uniref:microtubule-associated proteins 1A/1B light chain 3C-like n=1 Tax=Equus quagga TaxID=89248 RepID=UPI001EE20B35|nr:microtubule-associated proteins 1A/1B light chain 3C-like [Equus quagga]